MLLVKEDAYHIYWVVDTALDPGEEIIVDGPFVMRYIAEQAREILARQFGDVPAPACAPAPAQD